MEFFRRMYADILDGLGDDSGALGWWLFTVSAAGFLGGLIVGAALRAYLGL